MTTLARPRYTDYRFPAEIISHAIWLYFRFPLGLRMVEELLAARGISATKPCGSGRVNSASSSPIRSVVAFLGWGSTVGAWGRKHFERHL